MAMTSGQTPTAPFNADCLDWSLCVATERARPDGGVSVADQLRQAHLPWRAYMESMGAACKHPAPDSGTTVRIDPFQTGYATRHDPFVYYPAIVDNEAYCEAHVVDYGSYFSSDLSSLATTPAYAFITPDTCHDGHDSICGAPEAGTTGGLDGTQGVNAWLPAQIHALLTSPAFTTPGVASVLLITTDEAANTDATGCTTGPVQTMNTPGTCSSGVPAAGVNGGGRVGLLAVGSAAAHLKAGGTVVEDTYDHDSLLRTTEDALSLPSLRPSSSAQLIAQDSSGHINNAASPLEHSMATLFTSP